MDIIKRWSFRNKKHLPRFDCTLDSGEIIKQLVQFFAQFSLTWSSCEYLHKINNRLKEKLLQPEAGYNDQPNIFMWNVADAQNHHFI